MIFALSGGEELAQLCKELEQVVSELDMEKAGCWSVPHRV